MEESLLAKVTKELPKRNKTCVKNILILAQGIILKETVCLNKIKGVVGSITGKASTKPESHYKRLIRIFDDFSYGSLWLELLQFVFSLLRLKSDYLLLDGTSWERGSRQYHFITLCVVYQGVAIPIYWEDLQKKGNSSIEERKRVMRKAMRYYNLKDKILLADREYIGEDWFCFLKENNIDFVIRLRKKNYKEAVNAAEGKSYGTLERKALRSRKAGKAVGKKILLQGQSFTFVIVKNPKPDAAEPLIYLLSTLEETPARIAAHYPVRWKIETCFKHLKSNGFNLEKMNLEGDKRSRLLMALVVFAYTLSVCEGLKEYKKVPVKKYKSGLVTKAYSAFRIGLDKLSTLCYNMEAFLAYLIENIATKLPPYKSKHSIIVQ
jgi:hypothetical protein